MSTLAAAAVGAELPHAHAEDLARLNEGERVVRPPCARCKVTLSIFGPYQTQILVLACLK
jgi:hypothetical protein